MITTFLNEHSPWKNHLHLVYPSWTEITSHLLVENEEPYTLTLAWPSRTPSSPCFLNACSLFVLLHEFLLVDSCFSSTLEKVYTSNFNRRGERERGSVTGLSGGSGVTDCCSKVVHVIIWVLHQLVECILWVHISGAVGHGNGDGYNFPQSLLLQY